YRLPHADRPSDVLSKCAHNAAYPALPVRSQRLHSVFGQHVPAVRLAWYPDRQCQEAAPDALPMLAALLTTHAARRLGLSAVLPLDSSRGSEPLDRWEPAHQSQNSANL